jgi:NAD(P)-dependent dehydrogenase (short-subunit alcohol dehydrogenase family)
MQTTPSIILTVKLELLILLLITSTGLSFSVNMSGSNIAAKTKVVLVTGGNKGIGHAICKKLLTDYSETFVLLGARDKVRGESAVDEISSVVPDGKDRIAFVQIDTSSDESVQSAASTVKNFLRDRVGDGDLYGIVNNAGIGWGYTHEETVGTNYFGPRRVNEAFAPFLSRTSPTGRIVNVASASGPLFVNRCQDPKLRKILAEPLTSTIEQLDSIATAYKGKVSSEALYGFSKALLNAYTALHAKGCPDLIINSCSPGYIKTDLAPEGTGSPDQGAFCPVHLLMAQGVKTGWYYGSDAKRSPLDRYRSPGDPPFEGP